MFRFWLVLACLFPAVAAAATFVEPTNSSDVQVIEYHESGQYYYGELKGFPHTYQFVVEEPVQMSAEVLVRDRTSTNTSIIIIKEERRGVSEVDRRTGKDVSWEREKESVSNLRFWQTPELATELAPGVYRLEVSSPNNSGRYLLSLGTGSPEYSYFEQFSLAFSLHRYFGIGWVGVFGVWQVVLPFFILFGLYRYWRRR